MTSFIAFRSIQGKILFWTGLCLTVAIIAVVILSATAARAIAIQSAEQEATSEANASAYLIRAEVEIALDAARTLAQTFAAGLRHPEGRLTREQANAIMQNILVENPGFLGVWTIWEPNAFDGRDAEYANTPGHDATGRFIPYWNRGADGEISVDAIVDYEVEGSGDYYLLPKRSLREEIIEPYSYTVQGEDVLMTTLSVPIVVDGRFYGVAGTDIRLTFLQSLADQVHGFDGAANMLLISHTGIIGGATGRADLIGQPMSAYHADWQEDFAFIQNGEETLQNDEGNVAVFVPIRFGRTATPWSVNLNVPLEAITAEATRLTVQLIAICAILLLGTLGLLWLTARQIARPVREITAVARSIAGGSLDVQASVNTHDETRTLADAFNQMVTRLQEMLTAERTTRTYLENTVTEYMAFVSRVAQGDLTTRLSLDGSNQSSAFDGLRKLGQDLNSMVEALADMTRQVREAAASISAAAAEILAATTQQIASATEQDAAITQTMTTVEEVRATVSQTAERVQGVADASRQSVAVSRAGQDAVADTVEGMRLVRQRTESIAENILMLSERAQQIGEITATVNDIADQSRLLALNASIEAARAGEEGKGFAVVAMEVRQLADQSREATARVRDILAEVQQAVNTAVMVTEEGSKGVESGMSLAQRAGQAIAELAATIEEAAQASTQIAASTRQQTNGMDQLAAAMSSIKQASAQTAASTRQAERSAQDLNDMARRMELVVARYQV